MESAESPHDDGRSADETEPNGGSNGSPELAKIERDRIKELATASAFPEAIQKVNASFVVDGAEGLRATFPGQGTDEGDRIVAEHATAAFAALRDQSAIESEDAE